MATSVLRVLVAAVALVACGSVAPQDQYARSAAERGEPVQAIYSDDVADPWNRLFSAMFTRTVRARKTSEFGDAGPFTQLGEYEFRRHPVSTRTFEQLEDGDRAIAPFSPSFMQTISGERLRALEPLLSDALVDTRPRTPIDRMLMQADLWAVFDRLGPRNAQPLVARMIAKLALTPAEIAALPDQYANARRSLELPDLFSPGSEWNEIVWFDRRMHDDDAGFRQAARVFVRLSPPVTDRAAVFEDLRGLGHDMERREDQPALRARAQAALSKVDAVALVMQMLAIDSAGDVVPTPLVYSVQTRMFGPGEAGMTASEHELSRRLLRTSPDSGGFRTFRDADPGYIPSAGNDYGFASPHGGSVREPILGTLATRCSSCHGVGRHMSTFSLIHGATAPPVTVLRQPNETRARFVADKKQAREDYERLRALWSR